MQVSNLNLSVTKALKVELLNLKYVRNMSVTIYVNISFLIKLHKLGIVCPTLLWHLVVLTALKTSFGLMRKLSITGRPNLLDPKTIV